MENSTTAPLSNYEQFRRFAMTMTFKMMNKDPLTFWGMAHEVDGIIYSL